MTLEKIAPATVDYIAVAFDNHYMIQRKRGQSAGLISICCEK
jgi:hypothetical protein